MLDTLNFFVELLWGGTAGVSISIAFDTFFGGATDRPVEQQTPYYLNSILFVIALFIAAFSAQQLLTQLSR